MNLENLRTEYEKRRLLYNALVDEIKFALEKEIEAQDIKVAAVTGRTKTLESLIEKINRKQYENPLTEIDDLAGVRVICLFDADIKKINDIIVNTFAVAETEDKTRELGLDRMGYQSRHYIVHLSPDYRGARYDNLGKLRCEIQLRNVLQDAWAQLSHNLVYKSENSIPDTCGGNCLMFHLCLKSRKVFSIASEKYRKLT